MGRSADEIVNRLPSAPGKRRRVLLITYYYPPCPMIGALRPHGLAKYLPAHDWEILILTPRIDGTARSDPKVIETSYRDVLTDWKARLRLNPQRGFHDQLGLPFSNSPNRRLLHTRVINVAKTMLSYPDPMKGWVPCASESLTELLSKVQFEAIISSAPPICCHVIAAKAKERTGATWIADFRDLWKRGPIINGMMRRTLTSADALVTVSRPLAKALSHVCPEKPTSWITNGFDPPDFPEQAPPLTRRFSITYTGRMYEGKRDPSGLIRVVSGLIQTRELERDDIQLRFFGPIEPFLPALIRRFGLEDRSEVHESVPRSDALALQAESQMLLLLEWGDRGEQGILTGKLFEYLGSKRPILSIGEDHEIALILDETQAGVQARSDAELRDYLLQAYREYKRTGSVAYHGNACAVANYTQQEMAARFSKELDRIMRRRVDDQTALQSA